MTRTGNSSPDRADARHRLLAAALLAVVVLGAFLPALNADFTNWDDGEYVLSNPIVHDVPGHLRELGTAFVVGNYHPLTLLSLGGDYAVAGARPFVFHLTNVLLHVAATILAFLIAGRVLGDVGSAFVAALFFGLHPMHVESVAWIAERKDVLYAALTLASLLAYLAYLDDLRPAKLVLSSALFLLALLAKGQAVTLAVLLVVVDLWRGRRLSDVRVIAEKAPYFALAICFGIVAVQGQTATGATAHGGGPIDRLPVAAFGFVSYAVKFLVPYNLSAIYPYPPDVPWTWWACVPLVAAYVVLTVWALRWPGRVVFFGLAFFLVSILPVVELVPIGDVIMADRYIYLASFGWCVLLGYAYSRAAGYETARRVAVAAIAAALFVGTWRRCGVWRDSETLWLDTTRKQPTATVAWNNLGTFYYSVGRHAEAVAAFDASAQANPDFLDPIANRARAKRDQGDLAGAEADLRNAIARSPTYAFGHAQLGIVELLAGRNDDAVKSFDTAIALKPDYAEAYSGRGAARMQRGDVAGGLGDMDRAVELGPGTPDVYLNRGIALGMAGKLPQAIDDFGRVIALAPRDAKGYLSRARAYRVQGRKDLACADLQEAARCTPPAGDPDLQAYCAAPAA